MCGQLMECTVQLSSHTINLLLHFLGSGNIGKYSALWFCIVPPYGRANTATLELNIFPYCPPSHAIIYMYQLCTSVLSRHIGPIRLPRGGRPADTSSSTSIHMHGAPFSMCTRNAIVWEHIALCNLAVKGCGLR